MVEIFKAIMGGMILTTITAAVFALCTVAVFIIFKETYEYIRKG